MKLMQKDIHFSHRKIWLSLSVYLILIYSQIQKAMNFYVLDFYGHIRKVAAHLNWQKESIGRHLIDILLLIYL